MWRAAKDGRPDAKAAKSLRTQFVRNFCKASYVVVPEPLWATLGTLEVAVQRIAPPEMFEWGGKRAIDAVEEPRELLDSLLDKLAFSPAQRASVERQAVLFNRSQTPEPPLMHPA